MIKSIRKMFEDLVIDLSPENLSCDGEISSSETKKRYNDIMRKWSKLEAMAGRDVSIQEIEEGM